MTPDTIFSFVQIIFADILLSGDNALIIGMAAAGLSPEFRKQAIMMGLALAAGLRIVFAALASSIFPASSSCTRSISGPTTSGPKENRAPAASNNCGKGLDPPRLRADR